MQILHESSPGEIRIHHRQDCSRSYVGLHHFAAKSCSTLGGASHGAAEIACGSLVSGIDFRQPCSVDAM
jgi:hypothetical protein